MSGRIVSVRIVPDGAGMHVIHEGRTCAVALPDCTVEEGEAGSASVHVRAPLPGKVAKIAVRSGDVVERGATLAVLEAMKMELSVEAPRNGSIKEVAVSEGEQVDEGALLVTFAEGDGPAAPPGRGDASVGQHDEAGEPGSSG